MICFINKHQCCLERAQLEVSAFRDPFGSCYKTAMAAER